MIKNSGLSLPDNQMEEGRVGVEASRGRSTNWNRMGVELFLRLEGHKAGSSGKGAVRNMLKGVGLREEMGALINDWRAGYYKQALYQVENKFHACAKHGHDCVSKLEKDQGDLSDYLPHHIA